MKLIIDTSSLVWRCLLVGIDTENGRKVEHNGKTIQVNSAIYGTENAISSLCATLREFNVVPSDMIFVLEGARGTARRKVTLPTYKEGRGDRAPELVAAFNETVDKVTGAFRDVGAQVVWCDGCEADDTIAFLARNLTDERVIIASEDGDMSALIDERVGLWKGSRLVTDNPYGPFPTKYVTLWKATVGDSSDKIKGAPGFGPQAFMDFFVWADVGGLAALEGMIKRNTLHELEDDVAEFKPLRKLIDGAQSVYDSYFVATLHSEWVDTERCPLQVKPGKRLPYDQISDDRLKKWGSSGESSETAAAPPCDWYAAMHPVKPAVKRNHAVYDVEIIGLEKPVFLVCAKVIETGETMSFWRHVEGDMDRLHDQLKRDDLTWVSFNGIKFDAPLVSAAICGKPESVLKRIATTSINDETVGWWQLPKMFGFEMVEFDHIDLFETAPGVHISLKTFAGRMGYKTMVDMPFHHDQDLSKDELPVLERYCLNDLGVTEALFQALRNEVNLRIQMGEEHGMDLRSKSGAQVAEALLKKAAGLSGKKVDIPSFVRYKAPAFVKTDSPILLGLIGKLENHTFKINFANGRVVAPDFLSDPIKLGWNTYQFGVGGLHSTMDKKLYMEADDEYDLSDVDASSFYPFVIILAGLIPKIEGGDRFLAAYKEVLYGRIAAKRRMQAVEREISALEASSVEADKRKLTDLKAEHKTLKSEVASKKLIANSSFGKLLSPYCAFYAPDLGLAVTLTGQLVLSCLIHEIEKIHGAIVLSANTDGILVRYPRAKRDRFLAAISEAAVRTGLEFEETPYSKIAMKDVNSYINLVEGRDAAIVSTDGTIKESKAKGGKIKTKGLYADAGLEKNPTMQVCSKLAADYLKSALLPRDNIANYTDIRDYVEIRNVKGGGVQYDHFVEVDDWVLVKDFGSKDNEWARQAWLDAGVEKTVKRKSKPKPVSVGVGGVQFGRVARWYQCKSDQPMSINYVGSGNKVAGTDGGKLCMTLPDALPDDLDLDWYVREAYRILKDLGVPLDEEIVDLDDANRVIDDTSVVA